LTEEKIHLENGLKKIQETEKEVTELKSSLSQKSEELRTKQKQANEKLQQMLADQREAENEKKKSETLQEQIRNEKKMIEIKKAEVEKELADVRFFRYKTSLLFLKVLPAVEEAKSAVSGIKKQQLVEVRSMASPPKAVQLAVEAICLLLGEKVSSWRDIRGILVKEDFIPRIVQFNTEAITPEITEKMKPFVNNPDWEYEKVADFIYTLYLSIYFKGSSCQSSMWSTR